MLKRAKIAVRGREILATGRSQVILVVAIVDSYWSGGKESAMRQLLSLVYEVFKVMFCTS